MTESWGSGHLVAGKYRLVEKLGEVTLIYVDCGTANEPVLAKLDGTAAPAGKNAILGAWTTASRQRVTIFRAPSLGAFAGGTPVRDDHGQWVQVSRLGMPLVNEVVIGLKDKGLLSSPDGAAAQVLGITSAHNAPTGLPGRTATELAHDAGGLLPGFAGDFARAATTFNDVTYGERPGTEPGYRMIADLDERLRELEVETGRRIYTVLQLRVHPKLIELREKLQRERLTKPHEVVLTYITSRGCWYDVSWKGQPEKSGTLVSPARIGAEGVLDLADPGLDGVQVQSRTAVEAHAPGAHGGGAENVCATFFSWPRCSSPRAATAAAPRARRARRAAPSPTTTSAGSSSRATATAATPTAFARRSPTRRPFNRSARPSTGSPPRGPTA